MFLPSSWTILEIVENLFLKSYFNGWLKLFLYINTLFEFYIIYVWYWLNILLNDTFFFLADIYYPHWGSKMFNPKDNLFNGFSLNLNSLGSLDFYNFFAIKVSYFSFLFSTVPSLFYLFCLKVILLIPSALILLLS